MVFSPVKNAMLSGQEREADAGGAQWLPKEGYVIIVFPEGTACRELFLL
jgi:hypothetical protein